MKILIVLPREKSYLKTENYNYFFNVGLAYISAVLKKHNYEVTCCNYNHIRGSVGSITQNMLDMDTYDFFLIGGIFKQLWQIKHIVQTVKKHFSRPTVILGGLIMCAEPERFFREILPDYGVFGEAEETIVELLNCLQNSGIVKHVAGIIYNDKNGIVVSTGARSTVKCLDELPYPDFDGFGFEKWLEHKYPNMDYSFSAFDYPRPYPVLGSRGCFFNCTFCYHSSNYRRRSIKGIIKELYENVPKYKINIIQFYDECLALDKNRLFGLCEELIKLKKTIGYDFKIVANLNVQNMDEEIIDKLKLAGVFVIVYGFESFDKKVLKSMNKPIDPEQIEFVFNKTLEKGIGVRGAFIFGDSAETMETARTTLDWWIKNAQDQIILFFIQPYIGTEIYRRNVEKGRIKKDVRFFKKLMSPVWMNLTDKMTDREIRQLKRKILRAIGKHRQIAKILSIKITGRYIYKLQLKCPFCRENITFENCYIKNRIFFGFYLTCRKCFYRFYVVSFIQRIGYKFYPYLRFLVDKYYNFSIVPLFERKYLKK